MTGHSGSVRHMEKMRSSVAHITVARYVTADPGSNQYWLLQQQFRKRQCAAIVEAMLSLLVARLLT